MAMKFIPSSRQDSTSVPVTRQLQAVPAELSKSTWSDFVAAKKAQLQITLETAKWIRQQRSLQGLFKARTNQQRISRMNAVANTADYVSEHGYLTDAQKEEIQQHIDETYQRKLEQASSLIDHGLSIKNAARSVCGAVGIAMDKRMRYRVLQGMEVRIENYHERKIQKAKENLYTNASLKKASKLNRLEEAKRARAEKRQQRNLKRDAVYTPESAAVTQLALIREAYLAMKALPESGLNYSMKKERDMILKVYKEASAAVEKAVTSSGFAAEDLHKMIGIHVRNLCNADPEMKMMFADLADGAIIPSSNVEQTVKVAGIGERKRQIWDGKWKKTEADADQKAFISFAPRIPLNQDELTERIRLLLADGMNCLDCAADFADFYVRIDQILSNPDSSFEMTSNEKINVLMDRTAELARCAQKDGIDTEHIMKEIEPDLTVSLQDRTEKDLSPGELALYRAGAAIGMKEVNRLTEYSQKTGDLETVVNHVAALGEVMKSGMSDRAKGNEYLNLRSILELTGNYDSASVFGNKMISQEIAGENNKGTNLIVDSVQQWNSRRIKERQESIFSEGSILTPWTVEEAKDRIYQLMEHEKGFADLIKYWSIKDGQIGAEVPQKVARVMSSEPDPVVGRGYDSYPAEKSPEFSHPPKKEYVYDEFGNVIDCEISEPAVIQKPSCVKLVLNENHSHYKDVQMLQEAAGSLQEYIPDFRPMATVGCLYGLEAYAEENHWNPNWDGPEKRNLQLDDSMLESKLEQANRDRTRLDKYVKIETIPDAQIISLSGKHDLDDPADAPQKHLTAELEL